MKSSNNCVIQDESFDDNPCNGSYAEEAAQDLQLIHSDNNSDEDELLDYMGWSSHMAENL